MSDINIGQITEALNDKTDRDMMNVDTLSGADAVVEYQEPTSENDYTWYRKYASGWVEQGGIYTSGTNKPTIILPIEMANTLYSAQATIYWNTNTAVANTVRVVTTTSSDVTFYQANGTSAATFNFSWEVKGIAA